MKKKRSWLIVIVLVSLITVISSYLIVFGKRGLKENQDRGIRTSDAEAAQTVVYHTEIPEDTDTEADDTQIPPSLQELKDKYPETAGFVDAFAEDFGQDYDMDVSEEIVEGEIPLFIQWDKRWGYRIYGNDFFAVNGCGPTCLSMVVCGLTDDTSWNPYQVAMFSMENDYYIMGQGTSWNLMTEGARNLGLSVESGRITQWYIEHNLSEESPMICSMEPGDFTYTGHFIVLTGIDDEGKIIVNDPNSYINSDKHWDIIDLLPQIKSIWCYRR